MTRPGRSFGTRMALVAALGVVAGGGWMAWADLIRSANPLDHVVRVHFTVATNGGASHLTPMQDSMKMHLGETGIAFYEAENPSDQAVSGLGQYSVSPPEADPYLVRIACFCTTQQSLQPHERIEMPVTFYLDPSIAKDPKLGNLHDITLSYTYHEAKLPGTQASLSPVSTTPVN
ncbi:cytochrome c oxidase assembly protein CtaG [mine drainage metagenome]|uniref:Cytochrome c oxidase assembly protein CtaG n=1 Tax=mine drainage metagenome TaxID=410659 RepID=A0A1J5PW22_9ZZZZ